VFHHVLDLAVEVLHRRLARLPELKNTLPVDAQLKFCGQHERHTRVGDYIQFTINNTCMMERFRGRTVNHAFEFAVVFTVELTKPQYGASFATCYLPD